MKPASFARAWITFAGLAAVAGCAAPPTPPPAPSPTASIDGTYKGNANGSCGAAQTTAVIQDGKFTLTLGSGESLSGVAHADGSLVATAFGSIGRDMNFSGHVDGPDLRGGSYNGRCAFAFSLARQGS